MTEEINNPEDGQDKPGETLPPEGEKPAEGGEGADESQGEGVSLKDTLGKALGKDFPDDATALKAVKDTFSHVGDVKKLNDLKAVMGQLQTTFGTDEQGVLNKIDEIVKTGGTGKIDPSEYVSKDKFDRSNFYLSNPDYKPYSKMIERFQKVNPDKTREEIVEMDDFKEDFEKISAHDKAKNSKSILESSPRLGKATDKMSEAREAQSKGQDSIASDRAVEAVTEAYPMAPRSE